MGSQSIILAAVCMLAAADLALGRPSASEYCRNNISGYLPHESDCSKFIQCANGVPVTQNCGPNTVWNPNINTCDHVWAYDCSGIDSDSGSGSGWSPVPEPPKNECPSDWNIETLLPHSTDCGQFYQCVHGQKVARPCPGGLHFNPSIDACDWPDLAGCELSEEEGSGYEPSSAELSRAFNSNSHLILDHFNGLEQEDELKEEFLVL